MVRYFVRLRERMTKVGVPMVDLFYQSVDKAEIALREVAARLHYKSYTSGVGEPRDVPRE